MRQIKIFTYSLDLALSNKYLEITIECLVLKILNKQVKVLLYKIKKSNKTSTFPLNIYGSKDCMTSFKYLIDRTKSIL